MLTENVRSTEKAALYRYAWGTKSNNVAYGAANEEMAYERQETLVSEISNQKDEMPTD